MPTAKTLSKNSSDPKIQTHSTPKRLSSDSYICSCLPQPTSLLTLIYLLGTYVHTHVCYICAYTRVLTRVSQLNFWESVLFFHHISSGIKHSLMGLVARAFTHGAIMVALNLYHRFGMCVSVYTRVRAHGGHKWMASVTSLRLHLSF